MFEKHVQPGDTVGGPRRHPSDGLVDLNHFTPLEEESERLRPGPGEERFGICGAAVCLRRRRPSGQREERVGGPGKGADMERALAQYSPRRHVRSPPFVLSRQSDW